MVNDAIRSGDYAFGKDAKVLVQGPEGSIELDSDSAVRHIVEGGSFDTSQANALERATYGDTAGQVAAGAAGFARGATFGLSDQLLAGLGGSDFKYGLRALKEQNPKSTIGGTVAGAIANPVTRAVGTQVAASVGGAGLGAALLRGGAAGASEGALVGLGDFVSEEALGNAEATAENALASIGMGALVGGGVGSLMSGTGQLGRKALSKFRSAMSSDSIKKFAQEKAVKGLGSVPSKMARLEDKGRMLEVGDDLLSKGIVDKGGNLRVTVDNIKSARSEAWRAMEKSLKTLDDAGALFDGKAFAGRLRSELLEPLEGIPMYGPERKLIEKAAAEFEQLGNIPTSRANQIKSLLQKKIKKVLGKAEVSTANDLKRQIAGLTREQIEVAAQAVDDDAARAYIESKRLYGSMSEALKLGQDGLKRMMNNRSISLTDHLVGGAVGVGFGGVPGLAYGAASAMGNKVLRERGNAIASQLVYKAAGLRAIHEAAEAAGKTMDGSVSKFLRRITGGPVAAIPASVGASERTKLLTSPTYASNGRDAAKQKSQELAQMVANPALLADRISASLTGMEGIAPQTAEAMARKAAMAIKNAHDMAPKSPHGPSIQPMLDDWEPDDNAVAKFERYLTGVMEPMKVVEDFGNGVVSVEGVRAIKENYPEMFNTWGRKIATGVAESKKRLPMSDRVRLSLLFGIPLDSHMRPEAIMRHQSTHQQTDNRPTGRPMPRSPRTSAMEKMDMPNNIQTESQRMENYNNA